MSVRSISEIGSMWPLCKTCKHIAQCHEDDGCCELTSGQCPTCGTWQQNIKCKCKAYDGPTWDEFKTRLTQEEMDYYRYK